MIGSVLVGGIKIFTGLISIYVIYSGLAVHCSVNGEF